MVFATQLRKLNRDKIIPAYLDGKAKTIYASTLAATKLYRRALAARQIAAKFPLYQDFRRTSKRFAALPCNRPVAAKHMFFCLPRLRHLDKFIIA
jgi:hypothetical protein